MIVSISCHWHRAKNMPGNEWSACHQFATAWSCENSRLFIVLVKHIDLTSISPIHLLKQIHANFIRTTSFRVKKSILRFLLNAGLSTTGECCKVEGWALNQLFEAGPKYETGSGTALLNANTNGWWIWTLEQVLLLKSWTKQYIRAIDQLISSLRPLTTSELHKIGNISE